MNPDERNMNMSIKYNVRVYFNSNSEHIFPARNLHNAREIAKRVITEGAHIINENNEVFYPIHQIYKVKIIKKGEE